MQHYIINFQDYNAKRYKFHKETMEFEAESPTHAINQLLDFYRELTLSVAVIESVEIKKPTWTIPVSWEMYAEIEVEAEGLDEAIDIVNSDLTPLPKGNYVDSSFEVDDSLAYDINCCHEEDKK